MDNSQKREKLDLVWGSVFLTTLGMWGLTMMVFAGGTGTEPIGIALMIGVLLSLVTVPLLLSVPRSSATLLTAGRILLWLEAGCLAAALVLGVVLMIE